MKPYLPFLSIAIATLGIITWATWVNNALNEKITQIHHQDQQAISTHIIPSLASTLPQPRQKNYTWMSIDKWNEFHQEDKDIANQGNVDILFLGDSITQAWPHHILEVNINSHINNNYSIANFGIGGDHTQNLLWRLQNGSVGHLKPKVIVQMIGVNNMYKDNQAPIFVYFGVRKVTQYVQTHFPNAKILLMGMLPNRHRGKVFGQQYIDRTNKMIKTLADDSPHISYHDFGYIFLDNKNKIPFELMKDQLHPTTLGYEKLIKPLSKEILNLLLK